VSAAGLIVGYASLAYVFFATRYIRQKVLSAKSSLSTAFAYQESEFKKIFERMSSHRWPIVFASLWITLLGVLVPTLSYGTGPFPNFVINSLVYWFPTALIFVSLFWTYYAALRGIRDLGRRLDIVVPYSEDPFLGLKPIGNLALHIAMSFFAYLGILSVSDAIVLFALGRDLPSPTSLSISGSTLIFSIIGLAMFFFPLARFHARMMGEKNTELQRYNEELSVALKGPPDNSIEHLVELTRIQLIGKRILDIQEWPFDTQIIRTLLALFFSVVSSIGISVIQSFIHI
jgi:hypothetical protein